MKFCSIASGSSGNCIFIGSDKTSVLVDAGISGKRIEEGLNNINMTTGDIDGILVTHEHSDHIKGLGILARRYGIPIYATMGTIGELKNMKSLGKVSDDLFNVIKADREFQVGDIKVDPMEISHDAAEPVGYVVRVGDKKAAVATDMGVYNEDTVEHLKDLDVLLLESNHDLHMLQVGNYPYYLKRRIMGEKGHLSNEDAGHLLTKVLHDDMRYIFLGHLSRENNYEELAMETVCQELTLGDCKYKSSDFDISIAHRDEVGRYIEIN